MKTGFLVIFVIVVGFTGFLSYEANAEECNLVEIKYTYTEDNGPIKFCKLNESNILAGTLNSSIGGTVSIDVPRKVVDSVLGNCEPDSVFVLINGIEVKIHEDIMPTHRILDVELPVGDVKMEIVGSFPLVSPLPTQYCGSSHGYDSQYAPPLKQIKSGIASEKIFCNEGKILIFKSSDDSPACVKYGTGVKLLDSGWGTCSDKLSYNRGHPCGPHSSPGISSEEIKHDSVFESIDATNVIDANNQFALDFYSQVTDDQKDNVFFSPWSISTAFSIAYEGARGTTANEIEDVFGFVTDDEQRRTSFELIHEDLNQNDAKYKLNIANALWLAPDFEPYPEYVNTAKNYYNSEVDTVNFAKNGVDIINDWVTAKTEGKIEELFEPGSLDSLTRLVITNAIYFNGTWVFPFEKELTTEEEFFVNAANIVNVQMMNHEHSLYLNYTETEQLGILELPYEGDRLSMIILLPREIDGVTSLEDSLSAEKIAEWKDNLIERKVRVQMPKFTMETEYDLVPELKELGINAAFGPADFSGISNTGLYIDQAIHKAFVDVNEVGTEAAAATGIAMRESGPQEFRADHPFMFLIQDNETGMILFIGKIVDPSQ